ncbi:MAG TPA: response regulator [Nitrososphaeraceae archaeon]
MVDDEPDVTLTFKTVLENNGYTVDVFNDPIIALRNFKKALEDTTANEKEKEKKHRYSLVLTDIRMPNMNGFELYQKIRELDENIKVRFLTASEINHDEFKEKVAPTIDDTQNCIIEKPVDNQKLLNMVSKLMK